MFPFTKLSEGQVQKFNKHCSEWELIKQLEISHYMKTNRIIVLVEFSSYTNKHREREREYTREDKQPRRHWEGRNRYFITDAMIFWRWRRRWHIREVVERRRRGKSHGDGAFREILIPLLIRLRRGRGRKAWGGERKSCRRDHRSRERRRRRRMQKESWN